MYKLIEIKAQLPNGERTVKRATLKKTASEKTEAMKYAETVQKENPDNEIITVIALTAYELYGSNDNGDGFCTETTLNVEDKDLLQKHYKSFEENGAVYYQHQSNKEAIGKIHKAFLNADRGWVELVIEIFSDKAPKDVIDRIKNDEMVSVSMGCDVAYDVCSHCGHKAPRIDLHCSHVKDRLHDIIDGKAVSMLNPSPKFFDLSVVTIGGDSLAVSTYRKAASKNGKNSDHTTSSKLAQCLLKKSKIVMSGIDKMNNIYKGIEQGETYVDEKLKELYKQYFNSDIQEETAFDGYLYFTYLGLPYPLRRACIVSGVDFDEVINRQEELLHEIKTSPESESKFMKLVADVFESNRKPKVSESASKLLPKKLSEMPSFALIPDVDTIAFFNLVNKLSILGRSNYVKSKMANTDINNEDLTDTILTEYLLY